MTLPSVSFSGFFKTVGERCLYSEFFWSVFSLNAERYEPEKLRIRTLHAVNFTSFIMSKWVLSMSARLACYFNLAIMTKILSNALCVFDY